MLDLLLTFPDRPMRGERDSTSPRIYGAPYLE